MGGPSKIATCLWFNDRAEEAVRFYVSWKKLDLAAMRAAANGGPQ
jgi:predicted 3-demethylubiquinone-9 3-methyltransferase (glyoxalase superfamily)